MSRALLVTASYDKQIRFWDVASGRTIRYFIFQDSQVNCMHHVAALNRLVVGGFGILRVYNLSQHLPQNGHASGVQSPPLYSSYESQTSMNFTTLGSFTVTQPSPGQASSSRELPLRRSALHLNARMYSQYSTSLNPDLADTARECGSDVLYATSEDGHIRFFDLRTPSSPRVLVDINTGVAITCSALSPDRRYLLTGNQLGLLSVWHLPSIMASAFVDSVANVPGSMSARNAMKHLSKHPLQNIVFNNNYAALRSIAIEPLGRWAAVANNTGQLHFIRLAQSGGASLANTAKRFDRMHGSSSNVAMQGPPTSGRAGSAKDSVVRDDEEKCDAKKASSDAGVETTERASPRRRRSSGGSDTEKSSYANEPKSVSKAKPCDFSFFDGRVCEDRGDDSGLLVADTSTAKNDVNHENTKSDDRDRATENYILDENVSVVHERAGRVALEAPLEEECCSDVPSHRKLDEAAGKRPHGDDAASTLTTGVRIEDRLNDEGDAEATSLAANSEGEAASGSRCSEHASAPRAAEKGGNSVLEDIQAELFFEVFHSHRPHCKYILRALVSPQGDMVVTCSADYTIGRYLVPSTMHVAQKSARCDVPSPIVVNLLSMLKGDFDTGLSLNSNMTIPPALQTASNRISVGSNGRNSGGVFNVPIMSATVKHVERKEENSSGGNKNGGAAIACAHVGNAPLDEPEAKNSSGALASYMHDGNLLQPEIQDGAGLSGRSFARVSASREMGATAAHTRSIEEASSPKLSSAPSIAVDHELPSMDSGTTSFVALSPLQGHNRWVWDCVFSDCGSFLFSASSDNNVRMWYNLKTERPQSMCFLGHTKSVVSVLMYYE